MTVYISYSGVGTPNVTYQPVESHQKQKELDQLQSHEGQLHGSE